MPAEWEPHKATWLVWPHNVNDWPGKFDVIPWVYAEMIKKIVEGENIRLLVRNAKEEQMARHILRQNGVKAGKVNIIRYVTDRGWTRDTGPIFLKSKRSKRSQKAIANFHFNGWAKYSNWRKDSKIPELAARKLRLPLFDVHCNGRPFTIEGGGIDVNGRGTLITTEECYLHPTIQVRNPGLGRTEMESALKTSLGVTNIFWLPKGTVGDDTHGHIDDVCRFVNANTLVLVREKNRDDANYRPLAENWERVQDLRLEDGRRPQIVELPMPAPLYFDRVRLPASYANFYICNAAVIVPTFNDPNDRVALGILAELFPDRPVVGIHAVDLVWGFGTLHCLTQQEPG